MTIDSHLIPRPDDAPRDGASLPEVERWLWRRRTESAYGFDLATGRMVWERHTDGMEVPLTPEDRVQLRGMIFTHNHARGWAFPESDPRRAGSSFSPDDVVSAALVGLAEVRAISPHHLFSMRPMEGKTWPSPEAVAHWYGQVEQSISAQMPYDYQRGMIDPRQAANDTPHLVWSELAPLLLLQYRREAVDGWNR